MARQLAQDAAEFTTTTIADLIGVRTLVASQPWSRLLAEARALRFESEFLENPYTLIARALMNSVQNEGPTPVAKNKPSLN